MAVYRVHVILDEEYDDIEADSPEDAFITASDAAMQGGDWMWTYEEVSNAD